MNPSSLDLKIWLADPLGEAVVRTGDDQRIAEAISAAPPEGWAVVQIDTTHVSDRSSLHSALAAAGAFPSYYGANWDALLDCWSDPAPNPASAGWLWVLRGVADLEQAVPDAGTVLSEIARDADERLRVNGQRFRLLLLDA